MANKLKPAIYVKPGAVSRTVWTPADRVRAVFDGYMLAPQPTPDPAADTEDPKPAKKAAAASKPAKTDDDK